MKIRLKKSLSLPLVAVALASTQAVAADEGAKLSATGAVEARWYLLSSKTKATPFARTEELNVNLAINAVKDHTFAGVVFENMDRHHGKADFDGVYSNRTGSEGKNDGDTVSLVNLYKYFVGVDFDIVKITAGSKQASGLYRPDYQQTNLSTAADGFYWYDDGFSVVELPGITFDVPVNGWNIGLNLGVAGYDGKTNTIGLSVKGQAGPAAIELSTASGKDVVSKETTEDETTKAKVDTYTIATANHSRLAVSAPVGPVKLGLEYITAKAESSDADKDGTKIGAFKKAEVPNTLEFNNTWTALTVSGAQPVGADSIVYALDYKMTTEDIKSAKNKFDLSGYGVDVGYKMADMYKGGAVTPGIKFKNSTQKADLPDAAKDAEETFADQSLQRVELYGKYTYASFTGSLVYRMDTAKGEVFEDSSNSAKKTKKASSAFVKLAYNF